MGKIIFSRNFFASGAVEKLACMVGSFDCLHLGHEWICTYLLERFTHVLLLIPLKHYEKKIQKGENASFRERLVMLGTLGEKTGGRVMTGLTGEMLFLRLHGKLRSIFPDTSLTFAMGSDTYYKFLSSKDYFTRSGLPWGQDQEESLEILKKKIIVFDRTGLDKSLVTPPPSLTSISSSRVRAAVREWRLSGEPESTLYSKLEGKVAPEVTSIVLSRELYR